MGHHRIERIQSQLERILGEIFIKEGPAFGIGLVSINGIVVSQDLSYAKVLISFIREPNQQAAFDKLVRHANEIQTLLYKRLLIRKVPKLSWQLDLDPNESLRIEKILDDIRNDQKPDSGIQGHGA
ncbi:ribosome-binding factor A [candidate division Kazan bacterium RBG_13_50_9]|uniref:Ribosome-binding factor A n=1 Tax=candidate division Kazan bacterium RBG_13_50_9 TaxID=1798535 RepID=A0A1F4NT09_UNCK3|nr:MAG: ribosome-binding factor A [candidate division Kazan bacterium RBG_13_50_9]